MKTKKTKTDPWTYIPQQDTMAWTAQYIMAGLAWEFYKQNKRWPTKFRGDSIMVKGRNITVEMM